MEKVWDPLRKKEVALTPEEQVRQWFISVMEKKMLVPRHMMMSEVGMKYGDKVFRADILVYDRSLHPLMIVECKRPQVELTADVLEQAMRYNLVLGVKYIAVTNGQKTYICILKDGRFEQLSNVPVYEEMLK